MASSSHNPAILFRRTLSLADSSGFVLCYDSISQTSHAVVNEVVHNISGTMDSNIIYIAFETLNRPSFATNFIDVNEIGFSKAIETVQSLLPSTTPNVRSKNLVVVDSLNHIALPDLPSFISSLVAPHVTLLATYHKDLPEGSPKIGLDNYPTAETLLQFMATSIFDIEPLLPSALDATELRESIEKFHIPRGLNKLQFKVNFTNRRRSGRSLIYELLVDTQTHTYEVFQHNEDENQEETPEMLQDLTTFNLSTSAKQKEAKDQVALPFLEAQSEFAGGTAIVYEYEKDDDYDEEDPYEDPY
ncbi:similar to Saccharomyces cerevisiae YHR187W IKI1 Subunit of Elongator complex, which is required for modification of wobble nucleosides in tRNA [Maudiozyma barnettii]|uniref:Elongator complex protein 5 n=1 Tax=Maudiozyma barnettii TaxID=61262 RepID=A0A8H2ZLK0_9SACH|nr:Elongator subunit IKI1 [Kazachstania barnettii]CAB4256207.1 similar to Saccharomyces cerevisiae YHR187W IKI1 Subunit of Elongator complex, which is required for modification of wobble nucleosides in tRNA [Kazachstania barnettii]CAD1784815.1 similar to Saccharomyces cerevisiae YHR187W IKI1 Subunit of Elongator complex, which is required for modification of wobble nucleosides in tRNA [Kazachstania barnettii]